MISEDGERICRSFDDFAGVVTSYEIGDSEDFVIDDYQNSYDTGGNPVKPPVAIGQWTLVSSIVDGSYEYPQAFVFDESILDHDMAVDLMNFELFEGVIF